MTRRTHRPNRAAWEAFIPPALRPKPKITHCRPLTETPMKEAQKAVLAALALAFILPAQACRAQNAVKSGRFAAPTELRLEQDKGSLTVTPWDGSEVEYSVEFSGRFWSRGAESGRVDLDEASGKLGVYAGSDTRAKTVVKVPRHGRVRIGFGDGSLDIGPLSGPVMASVANGTLTFESAGVPRDRCVGARALNGLIQTPWGERVGAGSEIRPCPKPLVELEVINGTLEVK